jgi:hypothetical protein
MAVRTFGGLVFVACGIGDADGFEVAAFVEAEETIEPWCLRAMGDYVIVMYVELVEDLTGPEDAESGIADPITAGGMDFIHLSLECNAPHDVLAWADGLLTQYAKRRAIVTTHMDLGVIEKPTEVEGYEKDPQGRMRWVKIHGKRGNTAAD